MQVPSSSDVWGSVGAQEMTLILCLGLICWAAGRNGGACDAMLKAVGSLQISGHIFELDACDLGFTENSDMEYS